MDEIITNSIKTKSLIVTTINGVNIDMELDEINCGFDPIANSTMGPKGDTGPQGLKGDRGIQGENGQIGSIGPTGYTGAKGDAGVKGDSGDNSWSLTHLIGPPPQIKFGIPKTIGKYVYIPWEYPTQINVGFINSYLPMINTFSCSWSGKVNGFMKNDQEILSNGENTANGNIIRYQNLSENTTYITGIVLTNSNTNTGFQRLQFPQDATGVLRYAYVYYSSDFFYLARNELDNNITAWYNNYSTSSNKSTVNFDGSMSPIGPPSQPGTPTLTSQSISGIVISILTGLTSPTYVNTLDQLDNTSLINSYKISYSTSGSTLRYGGAIPDTLKSITSNSNTNISITSLYPDCSYIFQGYANNNRVTTYSDASLPNTINTTYLTPITFGGFSFSPSTAYSAKIVANNNSGDSAGTIINNILFSLPTLPWKSNNIISPIHSINNRGSTTTNLLKITGYIKRGLTIIDSFNYLNYDGFNNSIPSNLSSLNSYSSLEPTAVVDTYANNSAPYQGFYLQSNTSYSLNSEGLFVDSNDKTTVSLLQKQELTDEKLNTYSFYYQNVTTTPQITSCIISLKTTNFIKISGVYVIYNTIVLNSNTNVSNLGGYFYNKDKILTYSTGANETGLSNVTSGSISNSSLNNVITIVNTGSPAINYLNDTFAKTITITTTAYNVKSTSSNVFTSTTINAIIDKPSYSLIKNTALYPISVKNVGSSTNNFIVGFRIWSDQTTNNVPNNVTEVPATKRYVDIPYNHDWDLTLSNNVVNNVVYDATQELQIFNGYYGSKGTTTNGYLNYTNYKYSTTNTNSLDYSNILNGTGVYRFATFCWKCNINPSNYTKIAFAMNGLQQSVTNVDTIPLVSNVPILFYYRLEDYNNPNIANFTTAYTNTLWINANSTINSMTSTNYCSLGLTEYTSGTLLGGKNPSIANTFQNNVLTINASVPSFSIASSNNVYIYLRVGLPMSVNVNFTHITASLI